VSGLGEIESLPIYQNGWIAVQSESAMRAVQAADIHQGESLLDCCAAPGGKSAYADALADGELDILAWDVHAHRIDMMRKISIVWVFPPRRRSMMRAFLNHRCKKNSTWCWWMHRAAQWV
jgi:hypothetical protein